MSDSAVRVEAVVRAKFAERFGTAVDPSVHVAPGRVNLVGEHTDYNDGPVLPIAISRHVAVAAAPRDDGRVVACSADLGGDTRSFAIDELHAPGGATWIDYVAGVAWSLASSGIRVPGLDLVVHGDVPVGSGLSSSAAVEVAVARAFLAAAGRELPLLDLARAAQRAEVEYVGVRCGLMDQVAAAGGRPGVALLFDCRTLELGEVPMPTDASIVVMDTGARRSLATSEYNDRRSACERVATAARRIEPRVRALRDVDEALLERVRPTIDPTDYRRALHVVGEIPRPGLMATALRAGDLAAAGQLMNDSHRSLRDLYEVSSRELDLMCDIAVTQPGCHGARMTGAGFGGCAIALVDRASVEGFIAAVRQAYDDATYRRSVVFVGA